MIRPANDKDLTDKDWTDLIAGYVLGNLTAKEAESLQQQLIEHPELSEEIAAFQATADLIPHALPSLEPSAGLKTKLLTAASQSETGADSINSQRDTNPLKVIGRNLSTLHTAAHIIPPSKSNKRPRRATAARSRQQPQNTQLNNTQSTNLQPLSQWTRKWATNGWLTGISAGIATIAVIAVMNTSRKLSDQTQETIALQQQLDDKTAEIASLRNQLQETQAVTAFLGERATQVHALIGADASNADAKNADAPNTGAPNTNGENTPNNRETPFPTARLLAKAGEREIVFVAQDLPQLPAEQIYRLWAVADTESAPMYCGQFRQDERGTARWEVPDIACTNTPAQLLITLDAPDDPITSAGPLVLQTPDESQNESEA